MIRENCNEIFKKPKSFNILIFLTSILNKFTFTFTDCDIDEINDRFKKERNEIRYFNTK